MPMQRDILGLGLKSPGFYIPAPERNFLDLLFVCLFPRLTKAFSKVYTFFSPWLLLIQS